MNLSQFIKFSEDDNFFKYTEGGVELQSITCFMFENN